MFFSLWCNASIETVYNFFQKTVLLLKQPQFSDGLPCAEYNHAVRSTGPAVKGTLDILQACSANDVQKVVVVSSTAGDRTTSGRGPSIRISLSDFW
jgi:hypothetical protein